MNFKKLCFCLGLVAVFSAHAIAATDTAPDDSQNLKLSCFFFVNDQPASGRASYADHRHGGFPFEVFKAGQPMWEVSVKDAKSYADVGTTILVDNVPSSFGLTFGVYKDPNDLKTYFTPSFERSADLVRPELGDGPERFALGESYEGTISFHPSFLNSWQIWGSAINTKVQCKFVPNQPPALYADPNT